MTQTRYEIVSTIGVGATSRVDKAHDTLIDRTVALKTFGHGFGSEQLQKQFVREAQILGRLSHPNIVSIYDLGTNEDGSAYLVMEFVPGKTLESVMAAEGALPLSRVGVWAGDLANALNRAHRAGIIHGDIKPANIFVTEEGHIKLGDFGIARFATQLSGTGRLVGTPAYLSPEQIKGETQDHRSDIFSLGIILYQLATGVRPFDGSSVTAVCAQIVAAEPPPPSRYNPELPKEFDRIMMRCLAKDPNARYASGESLAASLYPFARSKHETAPNRSDFSWWKRPLRPRDGWVSAGAVSVALLAMPIAHHLKHARTAAALPASVEAPAQEELRISSGPVSIAGLHGPKNKDSAVRAENPADGISNGGHSDSPVLGVHSTPARSAPRSDVTTPAPRKSASPGATTRTPSEAQVPLNIEIASAIAGETLAVYADQRLVATSALSVTSAGETLHLERPLPTGPHEFRVALYRGDQSLHLERGGLAELQPGTANVLSIRVVRRAKMLVKRDAALEIVWPGLAASKSAKPSGSLLADSSRATSAR